VARPKRDGQVTVRPAVLTRRRALLLACPLVLGLAIPLPAAHGEGLSSVLSLQGSAGGRAVLNLRQPVDLQPSTLDLGSTAAGGFCLVKRHTGKPPAPTCVVTTKAARRAGFEPVSFGSLAIPRGSYSIYLISSQHTRVLIHAKGLRAPLNVTVTSDGHARAMVGDLQQEGLPEGSTEQVLQMRPSTLVIQAVEFVSNSPIGVTNVSLCLNPASSRASDCDTDTPIRTRSPGHFLFAERQWAPVDQTSKMRAAETLYGVDRVSFAQGFLLVVDL
jgi:hypothetical protein